MMHFFLHIKTIGERSELRNIKVKNDQNFIREICKTINLVYKDTIIKDSNINNLNIIQREISLELYELLIKSKRRNQKNSLFIK